MMDQTIELTVRSVYGVKRIYPHNAIARKITDLIGRKTFTYEDVAKLEDMGFVIKWINVGNDGSIPD